MPYGRREFGVVRLQEGVATQKEGGAQQGRVGEAVAPGREAGRFSYRLVVLQGLRQAPGAVVRVRRAGWWVQVRPEFPVLHHHGATIGRAAGARRHQHLELLWSDLLRWARKHHGARWAARAEAALRVGARLRLAAHGLAGPFAKAGTRAAWRQDDGVARGALAALRPPP